MRVVAALVLIAASVVATRLAAQIVPRPRSTGNAIVWWVAILGLATLVVFAIERLTRRLAPLAALLKLSLVFPDRAPSRFSVALRSGTVRQLHDRYQTVKRDGLGATPAEAARKVVELVGALNAHDRVTRGYCERVRAYTAMIAEELKLPADEIDRLRWAGLLHDLGKLEVPSAILNKKGELDPDEWDIIKTHPAAGARIAAPLAGWLGDTFRAVGEHHERWDGNGYPKGLAGEDIALAGRIVAVADAFDVMTAARSYKRPNSPSWARAELVRCAGTQFDPVVVRAFVNVSLGRLRWTIGPLSWLAQLPMLAQGPISTATGTFATTAMAASVAVGGATLVGVLPVAADPVPVTAGASGHREPFVMADSLRSTTVVTLATTLSPTDTTDFPPPDSATSASPDLTAESAQPATTTSMPKTPPETKPHTTPPPRTTTVPPENLAPVAGADTGSIDPSKLKAISVEVLDNDSDDDGDRLTIVSFTQPAPSVGEVTLQGLDLRYSPLVAAPTTFSYTISDGHGHTTTATVTIVVS